MIIILLICILLNLDLFFISLTLGFEKIKIPISSHLIISLTSTFILVVSLNVSKLIRTIINISIFNFINAICFIIIGLIQLISLNKSNNIDSNKSKIIEKKEAFIFGIIISSDSSLLALSLYNLNITIFSIFYFICSLFSLVLNNISNKIKIKYSKGLKIIVPLIFIVLGIIKFIKK